MDISVETTIGLERRMTIAVPSEEVDFAVQARLQDAARNVKLNGFRKGKIPLHVIKKRFGKGVRQEVVGELMSKSYYEALNQERIVPAGQPRIEATQMNEGEDLKFTAVFEVYPEIQLPDFSKIKVEKLVAEVTEDNINTMIETLREQRQVWEEVDREAENGDMINIDYLGKQGGAAFKGGEAKGSNLILGSERMIPGFEEGLIGKKAGDCVTLELSFPEKYHNTELAGKQVEFDVTLNKVSKKIKPELNEEFFASFGISEGGEQAFRKEVSSNMERELKTAGRTKIKNKVISALLDLCKVNAPQALIGSEIVNMRNRALQQMGGAQKIDPGLLPDDLFNDQARRRVVSGLILGEVIAQQGLKVDAVKVREAIEELASTYESPQEVVSWYYGNREQLSVIESSVLEDQVFDFVLAKASVTEKSVSYEEVIKPETPPAKESKPDQGIADS